MKTKTFLGFGLAMCILFCSACIYKTMSAEQMSAMRNVGLMSINRMDLADCDTLVYEGTDGNQIAIYLSEDKNDIQVTKLSGNHSASVDDCLSYAEGIKSKVLDCLNSGYLSEPICEKDREIKDSFFLQLTTDGLNLFSSDEVSFAYGLLTLVFSDTNTFEYFSLTLKTEEGESNMYSMGRVPFKWQ